MFLITLVRKSVINNEKLFENVKHVEKLVLFLLGQQQHEILLRNSSRIVS